MCGDKFSVEWRQSIGSMQVSGGNCSRQCYFEVKRCGKEKLLPGAGDGGKGEQIHEYSGKRKRE